MSWHWVLHTLSTAYTQHCLSSIHSHDYKLTPECGFSFRHASLHDWPLSASSPWELIGTVTLSHTHGCEWTNWWIESQHLAHHPSTASQDSSELARLQPWNSLDRGLQTRSITASKCISKLPRLRPPSSHDHRLQVLISKLARSRPPSASPHSLDHSLQVYLSTRTITASKFARSRPPSAYPNSLDHSLGVYLWVPSIIIFRRTSNYSQAPPAASPDIQCVDG